MIPISLSLQGFLSYQNTVEIDFTSFDVACITGENGAGKSSVLDAITWVLFGRARKHDESLINLDSNRAEVCLIFDYEGNRYRVIRTNPRGDTKLVEFHIQDPDLGNENTWQPLTERTIRETDQKIVDVLRLDYESFTNASFLLQGEADQFTQQNPSARKRILYQILGLEIWEKFRKTAYQKRKNAESAVDLLDGRLSEIIAELDQEEERKQLLGELEKNLAQAIQDRKTLEVQLEEKQSMKAFLQEQEKLIASLQARLENTAINIEEIKGKINQREKEQNSYQKILSQSKSIRKEFELLEKAREDLAKWEETAEKYREGENKRQKPLLKITAEKARLLQEQNTLQDQHQELQAQIKTKNDLKKQLIELSKQIKQAEDKLSLRDQKQEQLDKARENQADAKAENPRLYKEMKELEKRIDELEKAAGALCPLCGQELSLQERESLIKTLQGEGKDLGDRYRKNKATLAEADEVVKDLQLQISEFSLVDKEQRKLLQELDKLENQIKRIDQEEKKWETTLQDQLLAIQKSLENETYASKERKALDRINTELKDIGYDAAEHDKIREIVNQGAAVQKKVGELESADAAINLIDREVKELKKQLSANQKDKDQLQKEINQTQKALDKAKSDAPDTKEEEKKLLELKEKENILQREVGAAQQKVSVLETQKNRKEELEEERQDVTDRVKQLKQLEAAFGKDGVPALLIEQALPNIEAKANQILDKLSAGSMSIRFITQREYKDTKREDLKETLDIQIRDQSGYRDYEMYSGGESFRINFAIRLALSHILAQRAGARLQTLVVDEGFGSQDAVGRQRLIEAINLIRDDFEKILVITHVEQIKDAFSTQLLVEKTPQGSQVTLV